MSTGASASCGPTRSPIPEEQLLAITRALRDRLATGLDPRGYRTSAVLLSLGRSPTLSARMLQPVPTPPEEGTPCPAEHTPVWRVIASLQAIFCQALENTSEVRRFLRPAGPSLATYAVLACEWAAILTRQMGARSELEIDLARKPPDLEARLSACRVRVGRPKDLLSATAVRMIDALPMRSADSAQGAETPTSFQVSLMGGVPRFCALGAGGEELWSEPLSSVAHRVAERGVRFLAERVAAEMESHNAQRKAGIEALRAVCPLAAEAVVRVLRGGRVVGLRVCRGTVRGMAAEVYLFFTSDSDCWETWEESSQIFLEARRAHEEFILESSTHEFFYYPPGQLVARIVFSPLEEKFWRLGRPFVRAPQGSPVWVHPYVGPLHETYFSYAEVLGNPQDEAVLPMSPEGRALLPPVVPRARVPIENDMCLSGQDSVVACAEAAVQNAAAAGQEPDLLAAVCAIWEVVRVGLTRGHQLNTGTPRASLAAGVGRYPVSDPSAIRGRLAKRVFYFDPSHAHCPSLSTTRHSTPLPGSAGMERPPHEVEPDPY